MICPEVAHRQRLVWLDLEKAIREAAEEAERRELEEEKATPPECVVCGAEIPRVRGQRWQELCRGCREKGYRTVPCPSCGGPTTRTDVKGPDGDLYGRCRKCRDEMCEVLVLDAMRDGLAAWRARREQR